MTAPTADVVGYVMTKHIITVAIFTILSIEL